MNFHFIYGIAAGIICGAAITGFWIWRYLRKPFLEISRAADKLAKGEHGTRVSLPPTSMLGRLGSTLNLLAEKFQHDISELKRLEQIRKEFVANVSHELRTPLSSIKAYAETLTSGGIEDTANRLEFVREIETNADRMTRLIDDLLSISALESGKMPPRFEPMDLGRIASETVSGLMSSAQKKRAIIRLEPFHNIPQVRGDKNQIKQVFTNLIDNAVKYTGSTGIIRVFASIQNDKIIVSVQDNGCGISSDDLPRIFERFYRVDKARSRELGGTGLGLAIVKHIIDIHAGSVNVVSAPGQGSTFSFTLPALH